LHDREIQVRFDRVKKDRVVVYFKSQRIGDAKLLDLVANGIMRNRALQGRAA